MYDPLEPSPPHLAPERFYRTQPVSQERDHGRERTTHVDLSAPLNVGFAARAETATVRRKGVRISSLPLKKLTQSLL